jgi:hypothetical protein
MPGTHLRIRNVTGSDLDDVRVEQPGRSGQPAEVIDFGPVLADGYSDYHEVPEVYRFAHVEAHGPGVDFVLRPYDYVGEQPLPPARYTYRLGSTQGRLTLDVEADDG